MNASKTLEKCIAVWVDKCIKYYKSIDTSKHISPTNNEISLYKEMVLIHKKIKNKEIPDIAIFNDAIINLIIGIDKQFKTKNNIVQLFMMIFNYVTKIENASLFRYIIDYSIFSQNMSVQHKIYIFKVQNKYEKNKLDEQILTRLGIDILSNPITYSDLKFEHYCIETDKIYSGYKNGDKFKSWLINDIITSYSISEYEVGIMRRDYYPKQIQNIVVLSITPIKYLIEFDNMNLIPYDIFEKLYGRTFKLRFKYYIHNWDKNGILEHKIFGLKEVTYINDYNAVTLTDDYIKSYINYNKPRIDIIADNFIVKHKTSCNMYFRKIYRNNSFHNDEYSDDMYATCIYFELYNYAKYLEDVDDIEKAEKYYLMYLAYNEEDYGVLCKYADFLYKNKNIEKAKKYYELALEKEIKWYSKEYNTYYTSSIHTVFFSYVKFLNENLNENGYIEQASKYYSNYIKECITNEKYEHIRSIEFIEIVTEYINFLNNMIDTKKAKQYFLVFIDISNKHFNSNLFVMIDKYYVNFLEKNGYIDQASKYYSDYIKECITNEEYDHIESIEFVTEYINFLNNMIDIKKAKKYFLVFIDISDEHFDSKLSFMVDKYYVNFLEKNENINEAKEYYKLLINDDDDEIYDDDDDEIYDEDDNEYYYNKVSIIMNYANLLAKNNENDEADKYYAMLVTKGYTEAIVPYIKNLKHNNLKEYNAKIKTIEKILKN